MINSPLSTQIKVILWQIKHNRRQKSVFHLLIWKKALGTHWLFSFGLKTQRRPLRLKEITLDWAGTNRAELPYLPPPQRIMGADIPFDTASPRRPRCQRGVVVIALTFPHYYKFSVIPRRSFPASFTSSSAATKPWFSFKVKPGWTAVILRGFFVSGRRSSLHAGDNADERPRRGSPRRQQGRR